jgi:TonB-linked SusC/RagA family outer membrane protein
MENHNTNKGKSLFNLKFDLKMKITTFLLIVTLFNVQARNYAQNAKISLNLEKVRIEKVLMEIESLTDYKFFFSREDIDVNKIISIKADKETVKIILEDIFRNMPVSVEVLGKQIVLKEKISIQKTSIPVKNKELQQKIKITGTITDQAGMPLPGANVLEKGTTNGTQTDFDGKFTLLVENKNAILKISFIGFNSKEVALNNQSVITIVLLGNSTTLNEVVVGYGTQKKSKISGSIAKVDMNDMQNYPVSNFDQALAGKLAGVQVSQTSGQPGKELNIKVRGTGTITAGADPLYVIDGVPLESAGQATEVVNMEDIQSIQILKDAASAAIYGSRGGNGVVLISTKKGKTGKMSVNFDQSTGVQYISKKIEMMDAYEYAKLSKDGHDAAYLQEVPTGSADDPNSIRKVGYYKVPEELLPYIEGVKGLTNTDWQDEIYKPANIIRYSLSVSGASDKINYFISANRTEQDGIIINSGYEKTGVRANVNVESGKFKIGVNLSPSYTSEQRVSSDDPFSSDGIVSGALAYSPTWPVYNPDGSFNFQGNGYWRTPIDYQHNEIVNPVALALLPENQIDHYNFLGNLFVEYEIIKDLKFKSSLAINYNLYQNEYYRPKELETLGVINYGRLSNPSARMSTTNIYNWIFENTLNYKKSIGNHNFEILGGITSQKNSNKLHSTVASVTSSTPVVNASQVINADQLSNSDSNISEWSLYSLLSRIQYDFNSKYLLSASLRADASSRFGSDNKWGYFPSISAGWRISQEEFLQKVSWLNELKLRTSYGLTGNFQIGNYEQIASLAIDSYITGNPGQLQTGLSPNRIANPDLSWEKTEMFNIGLDVEIFKKQLAFTLEYYNSNTKDLLLDVPVPHHTGFITSLQNVGEVNNKGFEATVNFSPDLGNNFKWNSSFNISKNTNKVVALGPGNTDIIITAGTANSYFITRVGEPIGSYFLLVQDGVFETQEQLNQYPHFSNAKVGDFRFIDVDGDGVLDVNKDRAIVGNYAADFTYGFSNSFKYKGFDLNVAFQGTYGGEILNLSRRYIANSEGNFNNTREMLNRWQSEANPGDGNTNRANRKAQGNNGRTSTWHIEDGSYLRLQNLSFGYSLPKLYVKKIGFSNVRVYLSGNNLYTWSNYTGYNPEVSGASGSGQLTPGLDYGVYPLAKTYSLGFNASF